MSAEKRETVSFSMRHPRGATNYDRGDYPQSPPLPMRAKDGTQWVPRRIYGYRVLYSSES